MKNLILQILSKLWQYFAKKNDHLFRKDADFSEWLSQEDAGFLEQQGNKYQPSTDALVKVLKRFSICETDKIIDMGCGKGKAMYLMSRFPFGKISGYDLSDTLVDIANNNFKKLGLKQCSAIKADALTFEDYDEFNYFYIYNAFPEEIFEVMMKHVQSSIERKPRKCTLIYLHPVCHDYVVNHTPFRLIYKKKSIISWFDYYCYEC